MGVNLSRSLPYVGCEIMGTCKCYVFASNYWLTADVPPVLPVLAPPVSVFGEAIDALWSSSEIDLSVLFLTV